MNPRFARWIAWSLVGLYFILAAVGLTLQGIASAPYADTPFPLLIFLMILLGMWIVIGALIISRHPQHPVGWLLCAGLITGAIDMFAAGYAAYDTYVSSGLLPGVELALIWLRLGSLGALGNVAFTLIILLFPDGSFPAQRWRNLAWVTVGTLLIYLPLQLVEPGPSDPVFLPDRTNPLGVSASLWAFLKPLMWAAFSILVLCYAAAVLSLLSRLGRARGDERQQVKWLILPAGLYGIFLISFLIGTVAVNEVFLGIILPFGQLAVAGMIIAIAVAIFKYRLYDIDLIINRTLVYTTLTGALALVYYLGVVFLQQLFPASSQFAIVLSTLAVAALFTPLRRRIQTAIDRRFYRGKYDARQTLAAFSAHMRDEVELEQLSHTLLAVVDETMHPTHVSLWLKEAD